MERTKKGEKVKTEKKGAKDKKKSEQKESKYHEQPQNQNGNALVHNGKLNKKEFEKKTQSRREPNTKKKTGKWSFLGLFNILLAIGVLAVALCCLLLYTDGELSPDKIQSSWPRMKHNTVTLLNATRESLKYENWRSTARNLYTVIIPLVIKVQDALILGASACKNLLKSALLSLQPLTGDLGPYFEGLEHLWREFKSCVEHIFVVSWDWLTKIEWLTIVSGVRWFSNFMIDQIKILNEEFWRNDAIRSVWEDLKPARMSIWTYTVTFRYYFWQFYAELEGTWLPYSKELLYNAYRFSMDSIDKALFS